MDVEKILSRELKPNTKLTKTTAFKFNKDFQTILKHFWHSETAFKNLI